MLVVMIPLHALFCNDVIQILMGYCHCWRGCVPILEPLMTFKIEKNSNPEELRDTEYIRVAYCHCSSAFCYSVN